MLYVGVILTPLLVMFLIALVKMLPQFQRGVVFRVGKVKVSKKPDIVFVISVLEKIIRVDLRTITHDVPGQDIITKDIVSVRISAVGHLPVVDPVKASIEVFPEKQAITSCSQGFTEECYV